MFIQTHLAGIIAYIILISLLLGQNFVSPFLSFFGCLFVVCFCFLFRNYVAESALHTVIKYHDNGTNMNVPI